MLNLLFFEKQYIDRYSLSKLSINIYDKHKKILAIFDDQHSYQKISTKDQKLFLFNTNFIHADGDYSLTWKEINES